MSLINREWITHTMECSPWDTEEDKNRAIHYVRDIAQPAEDKIGKWIEGSYTDGTRYYYRCNQCFTEIDSEFFAYDFDVRYCPSCGTRMKEI